MQSGQFAIFSPGAVEKNPAVLVCFFLSAIAAAGLASEHDLAWGLVLHFVTLFALVLSWALWQHELSRGVFLAMSLAPIISIASLAMPLLELDEEYRYLLRAVPVLVGVVGMARLLNLSPRDIGITMRATRIQILVASGGIALGAINCRILDPEPLITSLTWQHAIVPAAILLVGSGIAEEVALRGVLQAEAEWTWPWGWVLAAIVSALLQIGHGPAEHCLFIFGVALFFGWTVKVTGCLTGVILAHALMIIATFLIFPFVL